MKSSSSRPVRTRYAQHRRNHKRWRLRPRTIAPASDGLGWQLRCCPSRAADTGPWCVARSLRHAAPRLRTRLADKLQADSRFTVVYADRDQVQRTDLGLGSRSTSSFLPCSVMAASEQRPCQADFLRICARARAPLSTIGRLSSKCGRVSSHAGLRQCEVGRTRPKNCRISFAISGPCVSSAKWPVSSRWISVFGTSRL